MWETAAFVVGALLIVIGVFSLIYPLGWIGNKSRRAAIAFIAAGFLVGALGAQMLDSYFVYLGLGLTVLGLLSVVRPLRFLFISTRRTAVLVFTIGILLCAVTAVLPASEKRVVTNTTKLDEWMPQWQLGEKHTTEITAPPDKVFAAIHSVTADEIFLFHTLVAIRRCGQDGPESILNAPESKPLLDVATQTTFIYLADDTPREIVVGTVISAPRRSVPSGKLTPELFQKTLRPGVVLATMNFVIAARENGGSTVTTETRVYANSSSALRRFGVYWRVIHPGSDLIRRMWLRAIARRAEKV